MTPRRTQLVVGVRAHTRSWQAQKTMASYWTEVYSRNYAMRIASKRHLHAGAVSRRDLLLRMTQGKYDLHMQPVKAGRLRILLSLAPLATWAADAIKKGENELFKAQKKRPLH